MQVQANDRLCQLFNLGVRRSAAEGDCTQQRVLTESLRASVI